MFFSIDIFHFQQNRRRRFSSRETYAATPSDCAIAPALKKTASADNTTAACHAGSINYVIMMGIKTAIPAHRRRGRHMFGFQSAGDEKVVSDVSRAMGHIIPRFVSHLALYQGPTAGGLVMHPYFLGYMKGFATSLVVSRCWRSSTTPQMHVITNRALSVVFGDEAEAALHRMVALIGQKDEQFAEGTESGRIVADVVCGGGDENHPALIKARESLRSRGMDPFSRGSIGKLLDELEQTLLYDRYKPEWMNKR
jgi:hypothetical protein